MRGCIDPLTVKIHHREISIWPGVLNHHHQIFTNWQFSPSAEERRDGVFFCDALESFSRKILSAIAKGSSNKGFYAIRLSSIEMWAILLIDWEPLNNEFIYMATTQLKSMVHRHIHSTPQIPLHQQLSLQS